MASEKGKGLEEQDFESVERMGVLRRQRHSAFLSKQNTIATAHLSLSSVEPIVSIHKGLSSISWIRFLMDLLLFLKRHLLLTLISTISYLNVYFHLFYKQSSLETRSEIYSSFLPPKHLMWKILLWCVYVCM